LCRPLCYISGNGGDVTALVIHGLGGVGKSTLAAQIAARMSRLAPERVVTVVSGEVSAAGLAAQPAETDLVVLDNFDDNLTCESGLRTVRDSALAALLAGCSGKLLITCRTAFTLPPADRGRFVFRDLGDLAGRVTATVQARIGRSPSMTEPTELSEALAEITAQAVGQQLFGELFERLSDCAEDLVPRIRTRFSHRIQSGQNQIARTHPNPLAGTDILGYRTLYAALNLLSPV